MLELKPVPCSRATVPVHHVHGERDRLIPLHRVRPDRVVAAAGHLLNVTHGAEVNDFIAGADALPEAARL
ncbi:MAG TPA: hypothetical protein VF432_10685 [Thermoanaerobaculia bacterium]